MLIEDVVSLFLKPNFVSDIVIFLGNLMINNLKFLICFSSHIFFQVKLLGDDLELLEFNLYFASI